MPERTGSLGVDAVAVLPEELQAVAPATGAAFETAPVSKPALVRTFSAALALVAMSAAPVRHANSVVMRLREGLVAFIR